MFCWNVVYLLSYLFLSIFDFVIFNYYLIDVFALFRVSLTFTVNHVYNLVTCYILFILCCDCYFTDCYLTDLLPDSGYSCRGGEMKNEEVEKENKEDRLRGPADYTSASLDG